MFKRFWAVLYARNLEFWRDRATLGWNIAFPVLLLVGFAVIFSDKGASQFKVGVLVEPAAVESTTTVVASTAPVVASTAPLADWQTRLTMPEHMPAARQFLNTRYVEFVPYQDAQKAQLLVAQHSLDLLIDFRHAQYWLNDSSPKGYVVERLLLQVAPDFHKASLAGRPVRYVDWVLPGVLGMNMMFSCLFGVGYVIVRYRKNSVLKRLQATPLRPFEFIIAQVVSRLVIVLVLSSAIYLCCDLLFDFYMVGHYGTLLLVAMLGALAMIALGLLLAARSRSEELTGGLLNMASWPMMILSGVWFSLEGAPHWLQVAAQFLPLTHLVEGARAVMLEGATLVDLRYHITVLLLMIVGCVAVSAYLFRWEGDGR